MMIDRSNDARTRLHYDAVASEYERVFFDDLSDREWLERLVHSVPAGSSVIDVGCGPGGVATYLQQRGFRPVGVDLSLEMMRTGRRARSVSIPFVQATMTSLPFAADVFDAALIAYSFLHIPRQEALLVAKEIRRVCRLGSRALLLLREGDDEGAVQSNLVPGTTFFACLWKEADIDAVLSEADWRIDWTERSLPATTKEIQQPKLALLASAV